MNAVTAAHQPAEDRYATMAYRRCGQSGLKLPAVTLGAWETFGAYDDAEASALIFRAFDLGITHFDFANNYGPPPGQAEVLAGRALKQLPRDEVLISTKAGFPMWPGPYGDLGSRKHLIASCDQSLQRLGVDYVDVFYHHRADGETPVEETIGALAQIVRQGKALYAGLSNYPGKRFEAALEAARAEGLKITLLQPYYNLLGRGFEDDLLPRAEASGTGVIAFAPIASGLLSGKRLDGEVPVGARGALWPGAWVRANDQAARSRILTGLADIAKARGQMLPQMAIAWVLRNPVVASVAAGASRIEQVEANVAALSNLEFSADELAAIDALTKPA